MIANLMFAPLLSDSGTVIVHLMRRYAPFVNCFFAESDTPYSVAPQHVLSRYADINHIDFNNAPTVSDGPFTFVRWVLGDRIEFAANPRIFMGNDVNVRRAIAYGIDKDRLVRTLTFGQVQVAFEDQPPFLWSFSKALAVLQRRNGPDIKTKRCRLRHCFAVNRSRKNTKPTRATFPRSSFGIPVHWSRRYPSSKDSIRTRYLIRGMRGSGAVEQRTVDRHSRRSLRIFTIGITVHVLFR